MEELDNTIILNDEYGNEVEFEFLDLVSYQEEEYMILLPADDSDGTVVILRVEDSDDRDEESYVGVEDEDVLNAVFGIFKAKFKDEFDFAD